MDYNPTPAPISLNESAAPEQIGATLRAALVALGGYMVGKGWIDGGLVSALTPILLIVVPYAWGQVRLIITHAQRKDMANLLPDTIAKVVP